MNPLSVTAEFEKFGRRYRATLRAASGLVTLSYDNRAEVHAGCFRPWPVDRDTRPTLEMVGDLGVSPAERAVIMDEMHGRLLGLMWAAQKRADPTPRFTPRRSAAARFILQCVSDPTFRTAAPVEFAELSELLREIHEHAAQFPEPKVDAAQALLFDGDAELRREHDAASLGVILTAPECKECGLSELSHTSEQPDSAGTCYRFR